MSDMSDVLCYVCINASVC